ncbi:PREDICTED: uncharacterized protein LOC104821585 [Tarenaya hassleriana]|uniref:uncharacterized protein LOC104821585 n=1 Tax=Tarenaya hassleriana TaxID=28532 RepID=UPI00053C8F8E|nr:PREDICTED: uncharacterized protein LOC104821585 [Tarenaya hassleriana]
MPPSASTASSQVTSELTGPYRPCRRLLRSESGKPDCRSAGALMASRTEPLPPCGSTLPSQAAGNTSLTSALGAVPPTEGQVPTQSLPRSAVTQPASHSTSAVVEASGKGKISPNSVGKQHLEQAIAEFYQDSAENWSPINSSHRPDKPALRSVPTWVTLTNLPEKLFNSDSLARLASCIGEPLYLHPVSDAKDSFSFAKIYVEVSMAQSPPKHIAITLPGEEERIILVAYEWLPPSCAHCAELGHVARYCPNIPQPENDNQPMQSHTQWRRRQSSSDKGNNHGNQEGDEAKSGIVEQRKSEHLSKKADPAIATEQSTTTGPTELRNTTNMEISQEGRVNKPPHDHS